MSGLTNNIDFLVHCVRHPGFASEQATTAFFDQYLPQIMEKFNGPSTASVITPHSVFALVAHIFSARTGPTAAPQMTKFLPWNSSSCGDWRSFGAVQTTVQLVGAESEAVGMSVSSSGDNFTVSLGEISAAATVKSIRKVDTKSTTWTRDESVWDISLEVDGHRRSATVCCYRAVGGHTVIDGKSSAVEGVVCRERKVLLACIAQCLSLPCIPPALTTYIYECVVWIEGQVGDEATHRQFSVPAVTHDSSASASSQPVVKSPMPGKVIKVMRLTLPTLPCCVEYFVLRGTRFFSMDDIYAWDVISI